MKQINKDIMTLGVFACLSIIITAFLIPSAWAMYGGESKTIEFSFETDNCTIPNESGVNFTFNGNNVLIEPAINFVGEFNITCYDWKTKEVKEETQTSGGFPSGSAIRSSPIVESNETYVVNETNETTLDIEVIEEIDEPEEKKSKTIWIILGIVLLIIILWAIWFFIT